MNLFSLSTWSTTPTQPDCVLSVTLTQDLVQCAVMIGHSEHTPVITQERIDVTRDSVGPSDHLVHHWRQDPAWGTSSQTVQCPPALAHSVK